MSMWYRGALCTDLHSEMFYPPLFKEDRKAPESSYYKMGKLVCENCPVQEECLQQGNNEVYGLWGGRTPKERSLGSYAPPKTLLPKNKVKYMPKASQNPLDIVNALEDVKQHLKRRPRKNRSS